MKQEQYEAQKEIDIKFIEKTYASVKTIRPQMNIVIETSPGHYKIEAIGGIQAYGREVFYSLIAPQMLMKASAQGRVIYISIMFEAEMRVPDIINGKPDLKNYRSKPAEDVIILMTETEEKNESVLFRIVDGKLVKDEEQPESMEGMMPNILKRFNEKYKK